MKSISDIFESKVQKAEGMSPDLREIILGTLAFAALIGWFYWAIRAEDRALEMERRKKAE